LGGKRVGSDGIIGQLYVMFYIIEEEPGKGGRGRKGGRTEGDGERVRNGWTSKSRPSTCF